MAGLTQETFREVMGATLAVLDDSGEDPTRVEGIALVVLGANSCSGVALNSEVTPRAQLEFTRRAIAQLQADLVRFEAHFRDTGVL